MVFLRYFFNLACFSIAFAMTLVWFCTYLKNEDSVRVDLKPFDFVEGRYPMASFCLIDPFIDSKLKTFNETVTGEIYKDFLLGKSYSKEMKDINFDDVTLNLADFYLGSNIKFRNSTKWHQLFELPRVTYSGFRGTFLKCFGLQSNFTNIDIIFFNFNSSLYPDGIRPYSKPFISVLLHIPYQLSSAGSSIKGSWPKIFEKKGYAMVFNLQQLEVLKRRNKRNDPCVPNELNFDQIILDDHLEKLGCKAPYHKSDKSLEVCDSKEDMEIANFDLLGSDKPKKACTSASIITFRYDENDIDDNDSFYVVVKYPNQYKEIVMIRAVDLQTVIGNAGGYIGLFLGKIILM